MSAAYEMDAFRTDNLLLLGAIHFQLRNFSESIFYNQQVHSIYIYFDLIDPQSDCR